MMERVEVSLSFHSQRPEDLYTERRILLDRETRSVQIGRTSKRVAELAPAIKNGWLDSPVISREHAELTYEPLKKVVFITDTESRHGTYLNHARLEPNRATALQDGDTLRFGIDIQRDDTSYPPPSAMVGINMNPSEDLDTTDQNPRTGGFSVPDESDSEASSEDDDYTGMRRTMDTLRNLAGKSHPRITIEAEEKPPLPATLAVPNSCDTGVIDLHGEVPTSTPTVVDLTRESPDCEVEYQNKKAESVFSSIDGPGHQLPSTEESSTSEPHLTHDEAPDHVDDQSQDAHELSCENSEQDESDDPECYIYDAGDAGDDVPISGHIAWEADSLPPSPVPVCSGALLDEPAKSDSSEESEEDSADYLDEYESDGSQSMDYEPEAADFEEEDTYSAGKSNPRHDDIPKNGMNYEDQCEEYLFDKIPCPKDFFSFSLPPPSSAPFTNPIPAPVTEALHRTDPRLSLPSILNESSHLVPSSSQLAPMQPLGGRLDYPLFRQAPEPFDAPSYWPCSANQAQTSDLYLNERWAAPNKACPSLGDSGREPAKTANPPLAPPSPLIKSGEKFLSCPPQEPGERQERESPELDMSSAWQFQQSKINSASKIKGDASPQDPTSGQPIALAEPVDPEVETATVIENTAPEVHVVKEQVSSASKRKADEISDLTDSEKRDEQVASGALIGRMISPNTPKDLLEISQRPSNAPSLFSSGGGTAHAPKRMRRVAEAARLVALGGAAAGVALFTTLVATAPTFT